MIEFWTKKYPISNAIQCLVPSNDKSYLTCKRFPHMEHDTIIQMERLGKTDIFIKVPHTCNKSWVLLKHNECERVLNLPFRVNLLLMALN